MGETKDKYLNRKLLGDVSSLDIGQNRPKVGSLRRKYFEIVWYVILLIVAIATVSILSILAFRENGGDGQLFSNIKFLQIFGSLLIVGAVSSVASFLRNRRLPSQIAQLEKNQIEILKGAKGDYFRSLRLAKIASRAEYEESMALDLDVMIARDGNLYEIGPDGNEKLVGKADHKPKFVTERKFTIGG